MEGYGTYMAQVAEISIGEDGKVKVHRIVCATDCREPDIVMARVEGSIVFTTSTLWGEITCATDARQTNFDLSPGAHQRSASHRHHIVWRRSPVASASRRSRSWRSRLQRHLCGHGQRLRCCPLPGASSLSRAVFTHRAR
jgi:hypothetical protein